MFSEKEVEEMGLKYYNADVHRSAFVLPQFVRKVIKIMIELEDDVPW